MRKPHLLYIAFWFPPSRASGVYRALATAAAFVQADWRVTVITSSREFLEDEIGSIDSGLEDQIPPEVSVARVGFSLVEGVLPTELGKIGWFRAHFPLVWRRLRTANTRLQARVGEITGRQGEPTIPDKYIQWIDPAVRRGLELAGGSQFDHILATGNPYASFEAARLLAAELKIPYSIDYRDAWTIDQFTGRPLPVSRAGLEGERRILRSAWAIFHVNDAIASAYARRYPEIADKQHVAPNGYDRESLGEIKTHQPGTGIVFGMLGTVTDLWPLNPVFEAWSRIHDELPHGSQLILGGHLGYFSRSRSSLETGFPPEESGFLYVGPVDKADVTAFYSKIDILVVPVQGGEMVTSGKIFEAMAIGRPFVCVQARGGGAWTLASDHPLAVLAEPDADQIYGALVEATEMLDGLDRAESMRIRDLMSKFERGEAIARIVEVVSGSAVVHD